MIFFCVFEWQFDHVLCLRLESIISVFFVFLCVFEWKLDNVRCLLVTVIALLLVFRLFFVRVIARFKNCRFDVRVKLQVNVYK